MSWVSLFIIATACIISLSFIIKRARTKLEFLASQKRDARKSSIKPDLAFYLKISGSQNYEDSMLLIRNTGRGRAIDISIDDFHHPQEKDWRFKFREISTLDRDSEISVDFNFFAGIYKASNKFEQLWMFDPDHDHDFASTITLSYFDIDKNRYEKTITIGEDKAPKKSRSKLIQNMLSQAGK